MLALGLFLAPVSRAQFIGGYQESWIACGKQYPSERKADKAVKACPKAGFSCEEVAARGIVSLRKGRMPSAPRGYDGPSGVVVLEIEFDETGRHASSRVVRSVDIRIDRMATEAATTWEVYPSCPGGNAIRQIAKMPFHFE